MARLRPRAIVAPGARDQTQRQARRASASSALPGTVVRAAVDDDDFVGRRVWSRDRRQQARRSCPPRRARSRSARCVLGRHCQPRKQAGLLGQVAAVGHAYRTLALPTARASFQYWSVARWARTTTLSGTPASRRAARSGRATRRRPVNRSFNGAGTLSSSARWRVDDAAPTASPRLARCRAAAASGDRRGQPVVATAVVQDVEGVQERRTTAWSVATAGRPSGRPGR